MRAVHYVTYHFATSNTGEIRKDSKISKRSMIMHLYKISTLLTCIKIKLCCKVQYMTDKAETEYDIAGLSASRASLAKLRYWQPCLQCVQ